MSARSDDIEKADAAAGAKWDEEMRKIEAKMEREGLVWCPVCDGCGILDDSDDDCRVCDASGTVARERAGVVTVLH